MIGIMQGRLSRPVAGRIQAFPVDTWLAEFDAARGAGLACIEWIYEAGTDERNPLGSDEGIERIRQRCAETGVAVWSVCADYYMDRQLLHEDGTADDACVGHLRWLIERCGRLGVRNVVLPFVDSSSLRTDARKEGLRRVLDGAARLAERAGLELHLETDLAPDEFLALLRAVGQRVVRANHDIGNSAALGYAARDEITALSGWVGSVHVKDRRRGGGTVPLGTGSADFETSLSLIQRSGFDGPFILQVARGTDGEEVGLAIQNRQFVERHLAGVAGTL